ncbi:Fur family transcriptional regulator [Hymenobacter qilianensis]|uniref:Fur family transcriptional regulator n=2 Tax=Hymenobacter qilianensis TaxID=1385715 RepID=A0ACB5PPR9_9BACT|nr:transcriptional repressor [Hymenobacter qilianensis]QNP53065.1 transcriptional repressor [Hymenobacter qilianensis]GGF60163.1 Fur family transcriptional regulator [Hymenobacter qilianensis]
MSAADSATALLAQHGLRQTPVRQAVLRAFLAKTYAQSSHDLEQSLDSNTDRITLYRTLKTFEEKGLIHRVIDNTDILRYALCSRECARHAHTDDHVHFKCSACQHTYCLNQVAIPAVALPGGFQAASREYLMTGVCQQCQPMSAASAC